MGLSEQIYATLVIDLKSMSNEQKEHLHKAELELSEAGITFDTSRDDTTREWELDWSLKGASLRNPRQPD